MLKAFCLCVWKAQRKRRNTNIGVYQRKCQQMCLSVCNHYYFFFLLNGATCEPNELSSRVECWLWICLWRRMSAARPSRYCCRSGDIFWKPAFDGSWGNRGLPLSEFMRFGMNLLLMPGRPGKCPLRFGLGKEPKDQCGRSTMRHSVRQRREQRSS